MARFISLAVLVFCFVAASVGAQDSVSEEAIEKDLRAFADSFFTVRHIQECADVLNKIRTLAVENIYEGVESMLNGDLPQGKTSSRIFMVYTITHEKGAYNHKFSVSRSPYLATAFGKSLVGMACERFNLPDPDEIWLSPKQVYHANWTLSPDEQAKFISEGPSEMPEDIMGFGYMGVYRSTSIELKYLDIDYNENNK
mgnify:FL=1